MSLTSNIKLQVDCEHRKALDMADIIGDLFKTLVLDLANGTGADQADKLFHDERSLSPGTNEDLDLAGVLEDAFGDTLTFVKIKLLIIYNKDTTHTFTVKPAASAGFLGPFGAASHTLTVKPSTSLNKSFLVLIADPNGYQVTASTADKINVAVDAGGSAAIYGIIAVGTSA